MINGSSSCVVPFRARARRLGISSPQALIEQYRADGKDVKPLLLELAKMKAEGKTSKAPLSESFGQWKNLKIVLLALFGLVAGQGVVWYTGQFYALFFLTITLRVDGQTAYLRDGGFVDYFSLVFDRHEIIFAEGAATESYHPLSHDAQDRAPGTQAELRSLFPELFTGSTVTRAARPCIAAHEAALFRL